MTTRPTRDEQRPAAAPPAGPVAKKAPQPARGDQTPAQYDDDGWGDTPVQMRG